MLRSEYPESGQCSNSQNSSANFQQIIGHLSRGYNSGKRSTTHFGGNVARLHSSGIRPTPGPHFRTTWKPLAHKDQTRGFATLPLEGTYGLYILSQRCKYICASAFLIFGPTVANNRRPNSSTSQTQYIGEGDSLQQIRNYSDTSSFTYSPNSAGSSTEDLFDLCSEAIFSNASLLLVLLFLQLLSLLAQFFGGI